MTESVGVLVGVLVLSLVFIVQVVVMMYGWGLEANNCVGEKL